MDSRVFLIYAAQLCWTRSSLGKKQDILEKSEISWLSEEETRSAIEHSFPNSRCCIVHIHKNATKSERTVLKWFVAYYKGQEYFTGKVMYTCSDYLLISSNGSEMKNSLESIPIVIASTRILAIIDSTLEEDSIVFHASMYDNSNVNLMCRNGSYTLSENYLEPRKFRKINRELQVSTYYRPPFCYLKSTIGMIIDGVSASVFVPKEENEFDGVELNIFTIIAKALNFTYTIRKPTGRYNHGRKYNDTAWDGGMIGQVVCKEVDMAFGGIWLNKDNVQFTNVTTTWAQVIIQLLVPRPKAVTSFWALTRPLSPTVWFLLLGTLAFNTIYIYVKSNIDPLVPRRFRNIVVTFTELLGSMLGTWLPSIVPRVRLQFVLWELAGLLIVTIYCSSLAARLTNPEFEERIDTVKQFIRKNFTWGRENTAPYFNGYFDLSDKYAKRMPSRFILEKSPRDKMDRILQGNHAAVGRIIGGVYYPEDEISEEALKVLRVMKDSVGQFYVGFAVQPWLLEPVMMRLTESGIVLYQMVHVVHRQTGLQLREVFIEHDMLDFDKFIDLSLNPLGVGFAALIFGLLLASAVFYSEIRTVQGNATLIQTLRAVKKRREFRECIKLRATMRNESRINLCG